MELSSELASNRMTPQPVSVDREDTLDAVLATFGKYPFRHLPVTGGNEVLGILSDRDVLLATGWLSDKERIVDRKAPAPHVVRDIMTTPVETLTAEATLDEAARLILDRRIGAVPIVDHVGLLGILTETDLLQALHDSEEVAERKLQVHDLMRNEVRTVSEEDDLMDASDVLFQSGIRHLPVVRDGRVVAMLSDRDVRLGLARLSWQDNRLEAEGLGAVPQLTVKHAMTERPFLIPPDATLSQAIACMLEERLGALPVVSGNDLIGILSRVDVLKLFLSSPSAA